MYIWEGYFHLKQVLFHWFIALKLNVFWYVTYPHSLTIYVTCVLNISLQFESWNKFQQNLEVNLK